MKKVLSLAFTIIILFVSISSSTVSAQISHVSKNTKDGLYQIINKNNLVNNG